MMSLAADYEGIIDEALVIGTAFCVLVMEDVNGFLSSIMCLETLLG